MSGERTSENGRVVRRSVAISFGVPLGYAHIGRITAEGVRTSVFSNTTVVAPDLRVNKAGVWAVWLSVVRLRIPSRWLDSVDTTNTKQNKGHEAKRKGALTEHLLGRVFVRDCFGRFAVCGFRVAVGGTPRVGSVSTSFEKMAHSKFL
jgi:hypothetical protein